MKIKIHENTRIVFISTEHAKELYLLGRIAAKFERSSVFPTDGDNKEVQLDLGAVIEALAK